MSPKSSSNKVSVTKRLLRSIALLGACVTLAVLAITWKLTLDAEMRQLQSRFEQIGQSVLPGIAAGMWSLDEALLQLLAKNMLTMNDIVSVEIIWLGVDGNENIISISDESPDSILHQAKSSDYLLVKSFPAVFTNDDASRHEVGRVVITFSLFEIHELAKGNARFNAIILILNFILISLLVFYLMRSRLSRHIVAIAEYARNIKLEGISQELILERKKLANNKHDELDDVVNAINHMRQSLVDDLARKKAMSAELLAEKEAARVIELERELANKSSETKSLFLANMSHEIRTPMNSIIGFLELSLEHKLSKELREFLGTASRSANSLLKIINDILDVSKLESGKVDLELIPFNLLLTLKDCINTLSAKAQEGGLKLVLDYDENIGSTFIGDPSRLRQVILNIVGNALKFTEEGSVTLSVTQAPEADHLLFSIKDTGIGMTPEQCAKVFDSFQQADDATSRKYGGTGLGTAISKQIVELMGGEMWVESELGQGSTFLFNAKLSHSEEVVEYEHASNSTSPALFSQRRFNVLIAEDVAENARLVTLRLEQQGHQVCWAHDGSEAVEQFKQDDFDLVLMDVQMPVLNGLEATIEIRRYEAQHKLPATPIIALTASILESDNVHCFTAGMNAIVGKPINFEDLFASMESAVGEDRGAHNIKVDNAEGESHGEIDFSCIGEVADIDQALDMWGDAQIYASTLKDYIDSHRRDPEHIQKAYEKEDYELLSSIGHAIKGTAANLSLTALAAAAAELESGAKLQDKAALKGVLATLHLEFERSVVAVDQLDGAQHEDSITLDDFDADRFNALLAALRAGITGLNHDEPIEVLKDMGLLVAQERLSPIQQHIESFEFAEADAVLDRLLDELKQEGLINE